jgi:hypothetical protein
MDQSRIILPLDLSQAHADELIGYDIIAKHELRAEETTKTIDIENDSQNR